ncbi:MAG: hypothetical protein AAFY60_02925 [Myxococcota bacterium]
MNDDELLKALGEAKRAQGDPLDDVLTALSEGRLTAEQARQRGASEADVEMFRPLGTSFHRETAQRLEREQEQDPAPALASPPRNRFATRPSARRFARPAIAAGVALAAALTLVLALPESSTEPLPVFRAEFFGGDKLMRGAGNEPSEVTLSSDSQFRWLLRPEGESLSPSDPWVARLFARTSAGALKPLEANVEIAKSGAIRVREEVANAAIPADVEALILVVADGRVVPADELAAALKAESSDIRVFVQPVSVEGKSAP